MINQYTREEIEFGFKPVTKFSKYLFGGNQEEIYIEYNKKVNKLKKDLKKLNRTKYEEIKFDITGLTNKRGSISSNSKYEFREKDEDHPRRIVDKLLLIKSYINDRLFSFLEGVETLSVDDRLEVKKAVDLIKPIYDKSMQLYAMGEFYLNLQGNIDIGDTRAQTRSETRKRKKDQRYFKNQMRMNITFWRDIRFSLEDGLSTVSNFLEFIDEKSKIGR